MSSTQGHTPLADILSSRHVTSVDRGHLDSQLLKVDRIASLGPEEGSECIPFLLPRPKNGWSALDVGILQLKSADCQESNYVCKIDSTSSLGGRCIMLHNSRRIQTATPDQPGDTIEQEAINVLEEAVDTPADSAPEPEIAIGTPLEGQEEKLQDCKTKCPDSKICGCFYTHLGMLTDEFLECANFETKASWCRNKEVACLQPYYAAYHEQISCSQWECIAEDYPTNFENGLCSCLGYKSTCEACKEGSSSLLPLCDEELDGWCQKALDDGSYHYGQDCVNFIESRTPPDKSTSSSSNAPSKKPASSITSPADSPTKNSSQSSSSPSNAPSEKPTSPILAMPSDSPTEKLTQSSSCKAVLSRAVAFALMLATGIEL